MSTQLTAPFKQGFGQKTGLAAKKAAIAAATGIEINDPSRCTNRIGIVFDDSGSMNGAPLADAKDGIEEFLRSCTPKETAIAVYPMNGEAIHLSMELPAIAMLAKSIYVQGSTPLIPTLKKMLTANLLTRAIVFSDGQPNSYSETDYAYCTEREIPIDTVYIGVGDNEFMRKLAADTGGIYLHFELGRSNFATAFKYLSPGLRYMLMDTNFVSKLEGR